MQNSKNIQSEELGEPSNFVRNGSSRKIIPEEEKKENVLLNSKKTLNQLFKAIHLEYIVLAEYKTVINENIDGVYVIPSRDNLLEWFGVIFVKSGPYQDGVFRFNLILDPDLPNTTRHPIIQFQSKIFHPTIDSETNTLNIREVFSNWNKDNHVWHVVKFLWWIFYNIEESLTYATNKEAANLWANNKEEFLKKAKDVVIESSEHLFDKPPTNDKHYITFEQYDPLIHGSTQSQIRSLKQKIFKLKKSWVLPGSLVSLGRPPTPTQESE